MSMKASMIIDKDFKVGEVDPRFMVPLLSI